MNTRYLTVTRVEESPSGDRFLLLESHRRVRDRTVVRNAEFAVQIRVIRPKCRRVIVVVVADTDLQRIAQLTLQVESCAVWRTPGASRSSGAVGIMQRRPSISSSHASPAWACQNRRESGLATNAPPIETALAIRRLSSGMLRRRAERRGPGSAPQSVTSSRRSKMRGLTPAAELYGCVITRIPYSTTPTMQP